MLNYLMFLSAGPSFSPSTTSTLCVPSLIQSDNPYKGASLPFSLLEVKALKQPWHQHQHFEECNRLLLEHAATRRSTDPVKRISPCAYGCTNALLQPRIYSSLGS